MTKKFCDRYRKEIEPGSRYLLTGKIFYLSVKENNSVLRPNGLDICNECHNSLSKWFESGDKE